MSSQKTSSSGVGFTGLLAIAFIILKLCGVITWSWWWVLSPIWISATIGIGALALWCWVKHQEKKVWEELRKIRTGRHLRQ